MAKQRYHETSHTGHTRGSAAISVSVFENRAVFRVVKAVFDFPVPSGDSKQCVGAALRLGRVEARQVVVVFNGSRKPGFNGFASGADVDDLAQARPAAPASLRTMAVGGSSLVDPELVPYGFLPARAPLFSTWSARAGLRRSWAKASLASAKSVVCGALS